MVTKFYTRTILFSLLFVFFSFSIYFMIDSDFSTYKSEWLTPASLFPFDMILGLANALVIGLSSFPLFFNKYPAICNNPVYSAASWFGLPAILIIAESILTRSEFFDYSHGVDSPGIITALIVLSCFAGLTLSYIQFRKGLIVKINTEIC